jgi:hypothetical protein
MADGDGQRRQGGTVSAPGGIDREVGKDPGLGTWDATNQTKAKANPFAKSRLAEDAARVNAYAAAGEKDALPEHQARRNKYPIIAPSTA